MANYTDNYQLHQWEAGDSFLRTDFNENFAKIDEALSGMLVFGAYTGNGEGEQFISLGFTPKAVITCTQSGAPGTLESHFYTYGGLAFREHPVCGNSRAVAICEGGFTVAQTNSDIRTNQSSMVYYYAALR